MLSLNYLHKGASKTWYLIPGEYKEKFDASIILIKKDLYSKNPTMLNNINL